MTPPVEPQDNADLPEHDVGVVVFARVRAVDYADAANIAESAVRDLIGDQPGNRYRDKGRAAVIHLRRLTRTQNLWIPVTVAEVRELASAGGDTYLRLTPTGKAYRQLNEQREREEDGSDEQTT
jgi:hypothetical protein